MDGSPTVERPPARLQSSNLESRRWAIRVWSGNEIEFSEPERLAQAELIVIYIGWLGAFAEGVAAFGQEAMNV